MAELLDSGARREFGNGAVRDVAEGKGRCDLLPLAVLDNILPCGEGDPLAYIEDYLRGGNTEQLIGAIRNFTANHCTDIYTAFLEVAKQYEDGAKKYADRNWEKGIPVHVFIDSGVRHYLKYLRGDTDEPHDRAFIWNMLGAIWTHENKPELIDLPFAEQSKPNRPTQAELEDLFDSEKYVCGLTDVAKGEPVKGKYDGLSNCELKEKIHNLINPKDCADCADKCPLSKRNNQTGIYCLKFMECYPKEFHKIAIEYLEGLEGK